MTTVINVTLDVKAYSPKAGDLLIVTVPGPTMSDEEVQECVDMVRAQIPDGVKMVLVSGGITVDMGRASDPLNPADMGAGTDPGPAEATVT